VDTDYTVGGNLSETEANRLFQEYPKCWRVLRCNSTWKAKNPKVAPPAHVVEAGPVVEPEPEEKEDVSSAVETTAMSDTGSKYKKDWYDIKFGDK
jgi:hypothetical protein